MISRFKSPDESEGINSGSSKLGSNSGDSSVQRLLLSPPRKGILLRLFGALLILCILFEQSGRQTFGETRELSTFTDADAMRYFMDQPPEYYEKLLLPPPPPSERKRRRASPPNQSRLVQSRTSERLVEGVIEQEGDDLPPLVPVFAFYSRREKNLLEKDLALIDKWKQAWSDHGYQPIVLTIQDAQLHPEFLDYAQAIDHVLANAERRWDPDLRECYLRFLAMAVSGGGMLVDLDMTPFENATLGPGQSTTDTTPAKFALYCGIHDAPDPAVDWLRQVETQNGLPCVAVGSASEWLRVGKVLGWVSKHYDNLKVWTDIHSLMFLERHDDIDLFLEQKVESWRTSGWDLCSVRYV